MKLFFLFKQRKQLFLFYFVKEGECCFFEGFFFLFQIITVYFSKPIWEFENGKWIFFKQIKKIDICGLIKPRDVFQLKKHIFKIRLVAI